MATSLLNLIFLSNAAFGWSFETNESVIQSDSYRVPVNQAKYVVPAENGVLKNDIDKSGKRLSVRLVKAPVWGKLNLLPTGGFTYQPHRGVMGVIDEFTYSWQSDSSRQATVKLILEPRSLSGSPGGDQNLARDSQVHLRFEQFGKQSGCHATVLRVADPVILLTSGHCSFGLPKSYSVFDNENRQLEFTAFPDGTVTAPNYNPRLATEYGSDMALIFGKGKMTGRKAAPILATRGLVTESKLGGISGVRDVFIYGPQTTKSVSVNSHDGRYYSWSQPREGSDFRHGDSGTGVFAKIFDEYYLVGSLTGQSRRNLDVLVATPTSNHVVWIAREINRRLNTDN